jgi:hypothetical protein
MEFGVADSRREVQVANTKPDLGPDSRPRGTLGCTFPALSIPRFSWHGKGDIKHGVSLTTPSENNHQNSNCSRGTNLAIHQCHPAMRKSAN